MASAVLYQDENPGGWARRSGLDLKELIGMESQEGSGFSKRKVVIRNLLGLHARPAAQFVQIANRFRDSEITVRKGDETVNGKSIMGMMMLAAGMGAELWIEARNGTHREAVNQLCELIENKFYED